MFQKWIGKNINLRLLTKHIEDFFTQKGFRVELSEDESGYTLSAMPSQGCYVAEKVSLRILGDPNAFVLEFLSGQQARSSIWFSLSATILGSGGLLLRGLKSKESLEDFEEEFWVFVEEIVKNSTLQKSK